jgi:cytidyltransferase-like protein
MTGLRALPSSVRRAAVVSGYFNPLHVGHLDMMEGARALADALVVIVNNDAQQVLKKGKVITSESERLRVVDALRVTDAALVAVDDDGSVAASLEVIHATYPGIELVFCNGGDRDPGQDAVPVAEAEVCQRLGIEMAWGVGGETKADSSSRINEALGL